MNEIIDNGNHWPATVNEVRATTIKATMAGPNGLNAIYAGPQRNANIVDANGLQYSVTLPPNASTGMTVILKRR